ncbi:hypothetical protein EMCRGX_G034069 [Ephydatia muelleri]
MTPLCLCKVGLQEVCRPSVTLSIAFNASLEWTTTISSKTLNPSNSLVLFNLPYPVKVVDDAFKLMEFLGAARFCRGSPDSGLVELWKIGSSSLHISSAESSHGSDDLTHLEYNAIPYTAGYVPQALKKKVAKSHHSNKKDLLLCLDDLSMCDDDDPGSSADWIRAVDRGSLIHINNMTFELFLSMEQSIRRCVKAGQELGDARSQLKEDENVLFYWSILTANRSDDVATTILEMVVDLWITVQGFSLAGAWVEEYKITQKKTTQKSKALRKN